MVDGNEDHGICVDVSVWERLSEIRARQESDGVVFTWAVSGGGCSGFRYDFDIVQSLPTEEGHVFVPDEERFSGVSVFVDKVSLPFLAGSTLFHVKELVGSRFEVRNPQAVSGCGCGVSFAL